MADPQETRGDEHVEKLLSDLKNIFGKLSTPEKQMSPAPVVPESSPIASASVEPASPEASRAPDPAPAKRAETPVVVPAKEILVGPWAPSTPKGDPESTIFAAIFYPPGKTVEARVLAQKLECLTPKFIKATFSLNVQIMAIYDRRSEWKDSVLQQIKPAQAKALLMLVDRPLEETQWKALTADLEPQGVYVEQVPIGSIEKKAFYTDLLLGMVFFYDAHKPDRTT